MRLLKEASKSLIIYFETLCFSTKKSAVRVVFKCKLYLKDSIKLIKKKIAAARMKIFLVTRISRNKNIFLFGLIVNKNNISNNKHDWTPAKHLNVLHYNRTQKQLRHFFLNILQKHYQFPILGTLDMSDLLN